MEGLPEVTSWYHTTIVGGGVRLVTEPHVHPLLRCNVWHVEGRDRDLVIDTAMGIRPLRATVERAGVDELLAVATHSHSDHVGGFHEFDHRAIHPAEADAVARAGLASLEAAHYPASVLDPYLAAGYEFDEFFVDAVPEGGIAAAVYEVAAAPATRIVEEGDVIDLGDRAFEVLHLPGHSPGSIGLWDQATGTLFSGDAVYDGPLLDELEESDRVAYAETMRRLRRLPVEVVHGGHEASFGRSRLVEICDEYLRRHS